MDALIEQGTASKVAWDELHEVMQRRRKLCEAESRREIWLQTHITLEQAGALFEALRVSVAQNVRDPQAIRAIQDDLTRLLGTIPIGLSVRAVGRGAVTSPDVTAAARPRLPATARMSRQPRPWLYGASSGHQHCARAVMV